MTADYDALPGTAHAMPSTQTATPGRLARPTTTTVPRAVDTLTTAEQLDALPSLAIVIDANDEVQQRHGHLSTERGDYSAWLGVMPPTCKPSPDVALPVTVLYVPGEQPCRHCGSCDGPPSCPDCDHADRPSVTDDTRAEAAAALRSTVDLDPRSDFDRGYAHGWHAAAEWAAGRAETTTDQALAEAWAEGHRTGWEHCQDGNYGNDHWDDPTPNPYAAAGRPPVTDNARAEAERRYNSAVLHSDLTYPAHALESHRRGAFVAGAEWAAGRAETTTATTEDAAQVIERAAEVLARDLTYSTGWDAEANDAIARTQAEALAESGLLATARTRPTRDDLARAIASGYETDHPTPNRHDYRAADAVLALLADQPDPADVWDEAVEKIREQHPACEDPCEMCAEMDDWLTALADNPYRGGDE